MLPSVVAKEVHQSVASFIREAFRTTTAYFQQEDGSIVERFLQRPGSIYKGPWIDIKLPFQSERNPKPLPFRHVTLPYTPYAHQVTAFERLSTASKTRPRSTIVATGTGSGKTECFMYPLLDHCLEDRGPGIKAIIVYPMNALATDQARRFAKEVAALRKSTGESLRVGLFTGDRAEDTYAMSDSQVITNQDTLRNAPPDILMTNYKMLDFLLMRPKDQKIWRANRPGVLRYLVVDELHTFDGAQGTDLACLIRRLRARLSAEEELICVGTSATIGHGSESVKQLRAYASTIFHTEIDDEAIIGETRLAVNEYIDRMRETAPEEFAGKDFNHWPSDNIAALRHDGSSKEAYLQRVANTWFGSSEEGEGGDAEHRAGLRFVFEGGSEREVEASRVRLGHALRGHVAFEALLKACDQLVSLEEIAERWADMVLGSDLEVTVEDVMVLAESMVSLVAYARDAQGDRVVPMLHVRAQLWLRELRRLVSSVNETPELLHDDDIVDHKLRLYLPLVHCRECLSLGWGVTLPKERGVVSGSLQEFYRNWFNKSTDVQVLYPLASGEGAPIDQKGRECYLCSMCGEVSSYTSGHTCGEEGETSPWIRVWEPHMESQNKNDKTVVEPNCAQCGGKGSLMIVGSQAASLASVAIAQLFGSNYADDRKLITFSDSVQDAAHRAGFFGARTFAQVTRLAMEQVARHSPDLETLDDFAQAVGREWRERLGDEAFVGTFIAPNMEWFADYEALQREDRLPRGSYLPEAVKNRLVWDSYSEFGLSARHGRSLERRCVATVAIDEEKLSNIAGAIQANLRERVSQFRSIAEADLAAFLRGMLTQWRYFGAFDLPETRRLVELGGNTFAWTRVSGAYRYLPDYGTYVWPPGPLVLEDRGSQEHRRSMALTSTATHSSGWNSDWFRRTLAFDEALFDGYQLDIMREVVKQFIAHDVLTTADAGLHPNTFLLNPKAWVLHRDTAEMQCPVCHRLQVVPKAHASMWAETACLRAKCAGRSHREVEVTHAQSDRAVPHPTRVVASEHTGLLEGPERLRIERSFIESSNAWDVNLLSSTPTLEMGINIGDLSSVLLCSVPPTQANYLQRIGRAGRRDGNALTLVIANGVSHDNYFYADPIKMMAGDVRTPGVFLQALAVLERQLIAYAFDCWAMTSVGDDAIPTRLQPVLEGLKKRDETAFPHPLLQYIDANADVLIEGFLRLFDQLDEKGEAHLRQFLIGGKNEGSIGWRILNRLERVLQQREALTANLHVARRELRDWKKKAEDEQTLEMIESIDDEIGGLMELRKSINNQNTLNFFTDEGLLPNYAFPEEGVFLDSVIVKAQKSKAGGAEDGGRKYSYSNMRFQRSASAALGELAPESRFYAAAHRLQIERVDLKLSKVEEWRLCDRCHYSENVEVSGDKYGACPRCQSAMWGDIGQKRTLIRLRQVYASAKSWDDRIDDSQENRSTTFYHRQLLVDIPPEIPRRAWRVDDDELPFGFEFLPKVNFRELNFGTLGAGGENVSIAGEEAVRRGFQICRHCGSVKKSPHDRSRRREHTIDCPITRTSREAVEDDWIDSLYLYRELNSESLRILLPLAEVMGSELSTSSLVAALHLGLRQYFEGDVQHLETTTMSATEGEGGGRREYLLVYDKVPGGTGYLKELMDPPEKLFDVFQCALTTLTECACDEDPTADGCYQCILAYREARNQKSISRRRAIQMLGDLVSKKDQLIATDSLQSIQTSALSESTFEERVKNEIKKVYQTAAKTIDGRAAEQVFAGDYRWNLIQQYDVISPETGQVITRSDMVLRLEDGPAVSGKGRLDYETKKRFEIHIFADGYQYHKNTVRSDVEKRQHLLANGRRVWTIVWKDLPDEKSSTNSDLSLLLVHNNLPAAGLTGAPNVKKWMEAHPHTPTFTRQGSLYWLLELLKDPFGTEQRLRDAACWQVVGRLLPTKEAMDAQPFMGELASKVSPTVCEWIQEEQTMVGGAIDTLTEHEGVAKMLGVKPKDNAKLLVMLRRSVPKCGNFLESATAALWIDDKKVGEDQDAWAAFWAASNLLQFAPNFAIATRTGMEEYTADRDWEHWPERVWRASHLESMMAEEEEPWADALDPQMNPDLDPEMMRRLFDAGLPEPEVGADLKVGVAVVGMAELLWKSDKVAVFIDAELPDVPGWRIVSATDPQWVEIVLNYFERGTDK